MAPPEKCVSPAKFSQTDLLSRMGLLFCFCREGEGGRRPQRAFVRFGAAMSFTFNHKHEFPQHPPDHPMWRDINFCPREVYTDLILPLTPAGKRGNAGGAKGSGTKKGAAAAAAKPAAPAAGAPGGAASAGPAKSRADGTKA